MNLRPRGSSDGDAGFSLVELLVAFVMLSVVMTALAPAFYGTLKAAGVTSQRSQATSLAVSATEQMRSLPYGEVGYNATPGGCAGANPVTLATPGPLDSMATTQYVGGIPYTIVRCVYWVASSIPGDNDAYKQTQVLVSWTSSIGVETVNQTSDLYPGGEAPYVGTTTTSTTTTTLPSTQLGPLTCTANADPANTSAYIDVSWTVSTPIPAYYVVYYTDIDPGGLAISGGSTPYTMSPDESGTSVELSMGANTTYYFQVEAVSPTGEFSNPSSTCSASTTTTTATTTTTLPGSTTTTTTVPAGSYTSAAAAQVLNLNLGNRASYQDSNPPTEATNNGSGSNAAVTAEPTLAIPGSDNFISGAVASQTAEANTDGTSYACAGLLSNGGTLAGGSYSGPCMTSGNSSGGVALNIYALPGLSSSLGAVVSGLQLNFDGATSWAAGAPGGTTFSSDANLVNGTVTVTPKVGSPVTIPLALSSPLTSPTDLVKALTKVVAGNGVVGNLATSLQSVLQSAVTLTGDYTAQSGATFSVSAIHIVLLSGGSTGDVAISTVGPNLKVGSAPCTINSLVVSPSVGTNGKGVALTKAGTLADESSFNLSVNVSSSCANVTVGYAPSGCTPGASGCSTWYAAMTGSLGTLYGTAGGPGTVWNVGTNTFTVFTGTPSQIYSPLTQQQVILCTEKGTTGKC